jgi:thioredoxin reductase (NADPH)
MGHGVSHCASCDGPLYNDKIVGVVGGGDSALEEALTLANYAASVVVFTREENFDGQFSYVQRASSQSKIVPRHSMAVEEILGDDAVSGVRVRNLASNETLRVDLAGLFVYVGLKPNTTFLKTTVQLSATGHVSTDAWMRTERQGLYAAGDIRQDSAAQAITCAGDGATAAIGAYRYIKNAFPK